MLNIVFDGVLWGFLSFLSVCLRDYLIDIGWGSVDTRLSWRFAHLGHCLACTEFQSLDVVQATLARGRSVLLKGIGERGAGRKVQMDIAGNRETRAGEMKLDQKPFWTSIQLDDVSPKSARQSRRARRSPATGAAGGVQAKPSIGSGAG
jgi:hypothetical protein